MSFGPASSETLMQRLGQGPQSGTYFEGRYVHGCGPSMYTLSMPGVRAWDFDFYMF